MLIVLGVTMVFCQTFLRQERLLAQKGLPPVVGALTLEKMHNSIFKTRNSRFKKCSILNIDVLQYSALVCPFKIYLLNICPSSRDSTLHFRRGIIKFRKEV